MTRHTSYWSKPEKVTHTGEISIQGLQILQVSVAGEIANVLLKPVSTARSFGKTGRIWIEHRALGEWVRVRVRVSTTEL